MSKEYEIRDKFHIKGRNNIYIIDASSRDEINMGDVFLDTSGHRFKVCGVGYGHPSLLDYVADVTFAGVILDDDENRLDIGDKIYKLQN